MILRSAKLEKNLITANGIHFSIFRTPTRGLPTLICLHGGPGIDHSSLLPGLLGLSEIFDLVFIDQRGDGESEDALNGDHSLAAYSADVYAISKALGIRGSIGLFGHSWGGCVAIQALAQYPGAFDFGILCNAPLTDAWMGAVNDEVQRLNDKEITAAEARYLSNPSDDSAYRAAILASASLYFSELPREKAQEIMTKWKYRARSYGHASESAYRGMDLRPQCAQIQVPCLAIGSEHDPIVPWNHVESFKTALPRATLAKIIGAGHFPFTSKPDEFFNQVSQWWELTRKGGSK